MLLNTAAALCGFQWFPKIWWWKAPGTRTLNIRLFHNILYCYAKTDWRIPLFMRTNPLTKNQNCIVDCVQPTADAINYLWYSNFELEVDYNNNYYNNINTDQWFQLKTHVINRHFYVNCCCCYLLTFSCQPYTRLYIHSVNVNNKYKK